MCMGVGREGRSVRCDSSPAGLSRPQRDARAERPLHDAQNSSARPSSTSRSTKASTRFTAPIRTEQSAFRSSSITASRRSR